MNLALSAAILLAAGSFQLGSPGKQPEPIKPVAGQAGPTAILKNLKAAHPRIILTDDRLADLKAQANRDELLARYVKDVLDAADGMCPPAGQAPKLNSSRDIVQPAWTLGLAWRWTGKEDYARQLRESVLQACSMDEWAPNDILSRTDTAHAVALTYDWLYGYLKPEDRKTVSAALMEKAVDPGLKSHRLNAWWTKDLYNFNPHCNRGLAMAALAVADEHPAEAGELLESIRQRLPIGIASFDTGGDWPEGPGYWNMTNVGAVYALAAFQTALGEDFGMSDSPGLANTGFAPTYLTGPTGRIFNYADASDSPPMSTPFLFWLARRYQKPELAAIENARIADKKASPQHVVWYWRPDEPKPFTGKLDVLMDGIVDIAVFRGSWDADGLFACIKGGRNTVGHAHLDLGTFVVDAIGQRWAMDLGGDSYSLPGYFSMFADNSQRWRYFRISSAGHNVPVLRDGNQLAAGKAKITSFKGSVDEPYAIMDMSLAYANRADKVHRGLKLVAGRRAVLVQDEIKLKEACGVTWGMITQATIECQGPRATLMLNGKRLGAEILAPRGATFAAESAERKAPEAENKGISRLVIKLPDQSGDVTIIVLLSPAWPDGRAIEAPKATPLGDW